MPRGDLFPEIGPFETGYLPLTDGHVMYWEQVGNPRGLPALFLHGGPGAGAGTVHRRFFDPDFWRGIGRFEFFFCFGRTGDKVAPEMRGNFTARADNSQGAGCG